MSYLNRVFVTLVLGLILSCGVAPKESNSHQDEESKPAKQFGPVSNKLFLTPEQEQCVVSYPDLKAEHIKSGVTIAGVEGTATFAYPTCNETVNENCITTSDFPAIAMDGIASKVALGQTLGGVAGKAEIQTQSECSEANQSDCIATSTYPTMNLAEQGNGGAAALTSSNFEVSVTSNASFEYWDASGVRNVSSGDGALSANNIKSGVSLLGTAGTTDPLNCASIAVGGTWILVPGDPDYGTNDFCVMKYEAKCSLADGANCTASMSTESPTSTAANTPWVDIDQQDSKTECASLGKGYHLITNDEWMTIATNLAAQGSNWDGGVVGTNEMARGHSDNNPTKACAADASDANAYVETDCNGLASGTFNQRRTHTLSNGEVIWDLAGNPWEWTDYFNDEEKPTPVGNAWDEFTDLTGTTTMPITDLIPQVAIDNTWNSTQSIGQYYPGNDTSGGALHRGGFWFDAANAGVFTAILADSPTFTISFLGFRCAVAVP